MIQTIRVNRSLFVSAFMTLVLTLFLSATLSCTRAPSESNTWPVAAGAIYPNTSFIDSNSIPFKLHDIQGKVIVLEFIGMSCAGCQALAGAHEAGALHGVQPQAGVPTLDTLLGPYAHHERVTVLQILLYNPGLQQTTVADAKLWSGHFNKSKRTSFRVVVPEKDMRSQTAYDSIPGVQVLDSGFRVRFDARGHHPRDDMFRDLQSTIGDVLKTPTDSKADVRAAYKSIPHRQTPYRISQSSLSKEQSAALVELFSLTDVALVARTQTLSWVLSDSKKGMSVQQYEQRMQEIYHTLEQQKARHSVIDSVYLEIQKALKEQEAYFKKRPTSSYARDPHVRKASEHLKKAYSILMSQFSSESATNKQAFFDHLCALDFI